MPADVTYIVNRFKRIVMAVDTYAAALANPPKKRSFNSETEITDIVLEADELLCLDIRETVEHPYAATFFTLSAALVHGDAIPASDGVIHAVRWSTTSGGTYILSEEGNKDDIISAVADFTIYGAAATDIYGYHYIERGVLYTTNPFTKVTQTQFTRTSACQAPQSYTNGILSTAVSIAYRDSMDIPVVEYYRRKSDEFRSMIRQKAETLPKMAEAI